MVCMYLYSLNLRHTKIIDIQNQLDRLCKARQVWEYIKKQHMLLELIDHLWKFKMPPKKRNQVQLDSTQLDKRALKVVLKQVSRQLNHYIVCLKDSWYKYQ
jgi:hypothetical protein